MKCRIKKQTLGRFIVLARGLFFALLSGAGVGQFSIAGTFVQPHFLTVGSFALGLEPEVFFSNGASVGANFHYSHGIHEMVNVGATLGTGDGNRRFRVGPRAVFEFFPDSAKQPGIGVATSAMFVKLRSGLVLELGANPFIHKSFVLEGGREVEPFFALPLGLRFDDGRYEGTFGVTVGAIFRIVEKLSGSFEFCVAALNSESYVSGGVSFSP